MSVISKRQQNHFILSVLVFTRQLRVVVSAVRGLRDNSSVLCCVVYCSHRGVPRRTLSPLGTFGRGFSPLASSLCSFQRTSGDEKREKAAYRCDNSTSWHEIHEMTSFNNEIIQWSIRKVFQGLLKWNANDYARHLRDRYLVVDASPSTQNLWTITVLNFAIRTCPLKLTTKQLITGHNRISEFVRIYQHIFDACWCEKYCAAEVVLDSLKKKMALFA